MTEREEKTWAANLAKEIAAGPLMRERLEVVQRRRYALHRLLVHLQAWRLLLLPDSEWAPDLANKEVEVQLRVDSYGALLHEMTATQVHQEVVEAADELERRLLAR
jgi:hypothetical protein